MYAASGQCFLPIEIQQNIISRLELPSLKALRLASSTFAAIGAEYLLPEVYLLYRITSFQRLGEISRHPIISQHVTTLFYEADRLNHFADRDKWEKCVEGPEWLDRRPKCPPSTAASEVWNAYRAASDTWSEGPHHSYTEVELARGWKNYLDIYAEQQAISTHNLDHYHIAHAILCFPKLSHIYLSINDAVGPFHSALELSYAQGLVMPQGECTLDPDEPEGLRQFTSLAYFALDRRGLHPSLYMYSQQTALRTLHIGAVSWRIFSETWPAQQALYQTTLAHVTDVELLLNVGQSRELGGNEEIECRQFFRQTGALRKFLTAAPKLEKLHIDLYVDDPKWKMLDLCDLVGDGEFTWEALREVGFEVNTHEEELIAFLTRHKKTLRILFMEDGLTLMGPGASVATLLLRMRDVIEWEEVSQEGSLFVVSSGVEWDLGVPGDEEEGLEEARLGRRMEDFLMRKSDVNPFEERGG